MGDGLWGPWNWWSQCSRTCGGGNKTRIRDCDSPIPAHGGKECVGNATLTKECKKETCPVNGMWEAWSGMHMWSECSKTCGGGKTERTRECNSPAPAHGGKDCKGEAT